MTTKKIVKIIKELLKSCKEKNVEHYGHQYLVGYETALSDLMRDINGTIQRELDGEMTELGERNYALISRGLKSMGSFDPDEIFFVFEEQLYVHEADTIWKFLAWVNDGKEIELHGIKMSDRAFGSGNYEERFQEFLNDREYQDSLIQDEQRYEDQH